MERHHVIAKRVTDNLFTPQKRDELGDAAPTMLANDRTFISWFRTGLQIAIGGFGAAQLIQSSMDVTSVKAITMMYVLLGIIFIIVGLLRHLQVAVLMPDGKFPSSGWVMVMITAIGLGVFIATMVLVLIDPSA